MKLIMGAALAVAAVAVTSLGQLAWLPGVDSLAAAPVAALQDSPIDHEVAADVAQDMRRYALNALLVPVLDDEEYPARWLDPSLAMPCYPGTQVLVDGRPIEPRAELSGRAFSLQRTMNSCLPFGAGGPELSRRADLLVFRDDDGWSANVRFVDLHLTYRGQAIVMNRAFAASDSMNAMHAAVCRVAVSAAFLMCASVAPAQPAAEAGMLERLKRTYLVCDHTSTVRRLTPTETALCSEAAESLLQQAFGGDFDRLLSWWREQRARRQAPEAWER